MSRLLNETTLHALLQAELPQWQLHEGRLRREYPTAGWKSSLLLANAIGHLAELAWHHPDLLVTYPKLVVELTTHSAGGITIKDIELAKRIEALASWRPAQDAGGLEGTPADDPQAAYLPRFLRTHLS